MYDIQYTIHLFLSVGLEQNNKRKKRNQLNKIIVHERATKGNKVFAEKK